MAVMGGQIRVGQNAQRADSGRLFAVGVVAGDILGDFPGYQRGTADVGLLPAGVPHHIEQAAGAHRCAHIQLAVGLQG